MRDLTPRLYSHYTPIMPLLFAGYASLFPRNAYAGTIFSLLVGLLAAAVALFWVLRQSLDHSGLRRWAALAVAVLPVVFITHDRPEAIGFVLFSVTVAIAAKPRPRPVLSGILIALTFLAHPFVAIIAAVWTTALALSRNWNLPGRWISSILQTAITAASAVAVLLPVAVLYYTLDHNSLARFAAHALGIHSGFAVAGGFSSHGSYQAALLHAGGFGRSAVDTATYLLFLSSSLLLAGWAILHRGKLSHGEWFPIAAGLASVLMSLSMFSIQANYITLLAFAVPLGLLIASRQGANLAAPALALLLFAIFIKVPVFAVDMVERIEQRSSYQAARDQPPYLLDHLPSPNSLVALEGDSYDLFKPEFHRMVSLYEGQGASSYAEVAGIANCYDTFHGPADAVRPLPEQLNPAEFHMIQADPEHMWITLLGHKVMRGQWGYGCDLYVRNNPAPGGK